MSIQLKRIEEGVRSLQKKRARKGRGESERGHSTCTELKVKKKSEMSKVLTAKSDDYYRRQLGLSGLQSSFDKDSLPDYDEFDSESVTLEYFKESRRC